MNGWIFCGVGFVGGLIVGGVVFGRIVLKEVNGRIKALQEERNYLLKERREKAEKATRARLRAIERAEKDLERENSLSEMERLSAEYRSDSFDDHFMTRVGPQDDEPEDDSDDSDDSSDGIRVIDRETFYQESNDRDIEDLDYFQEDGILAEKGGGDIVYDQESVLGETMTGDIDDVIDDEIYISNDEMDCLYRISVHHEASYYRDALGIG